ncbi:phycobilisome linker polypeptide [Trichormus variabilis]|uniref:Phycobilisome 32.1 kDa linker polypeptide, phycocyanin-associated, rod n=1 Tax=Trichormus variabilis SAG 1403-4b TaxID=447716 RepID=A0A3S1A5K4_ANAVA|nr:phycobilisome linker polypeptide [Trichormus variabilis]MBD2628729.1 phycobilisome linker polypeptide [Trichormus variabilis FACHB-164]RUS94054.1 phycobilisome 32.1 kDa linker polypeptide, phycocyanin-associated, rod [Trichormus variabilis SAG 1403-4b]
MTLSMEERLGISAVVDQKLELRPNWSEDRLQQVFRAAYEHIFGRERVYVGGIFANQESMLRNGQISVRQFVQTLAKSEFYKERFFYNNSQIRFIELNYKHLLGRAPYDQSEIAYHTDIYASSGYDAEIDSYIDSQEYNNAFGDNTVPYFRGFKSIPGMKQVGFNRLFTLYRGNGNSDNAGSKSPRLRQQLAMNLPNTIIPPTTSIRFASALGVGQLNSSPARGDNRMYVIEVIAGGVGTKVAVRRSRQSYTVPFDQLSQKYQEIHKRGGKIISINPV